jgi:hypothetical protein
MRIARQFHRNQFADTKGLGDGAGHKLVGRGDDGHGVSQALVLLDQSQGLWFDGFLDAIPHEICMSSYRTNSALPADSRRGKTHVVVHIQCAGLVLGVKVVISPGLNSTGSTQPWWW